MIGQCGLIFKKTSNQPKCKAIYLISKNFSLIKYNPYKINSNLFKDDFSKYFSDHAFTDLPIYYYQLIQWSFYNRKWNNLLFFL